MTKRSFDGEEHDDSVVTKKLKPLRADRVSRLSDELILRIFSFLPVADLLACERISFHFKHLAEDGHLWKLLYYEHFVRPRARKIPGARDIAPSNDTQLASKVLRWLDEEHLVKRGTNWKRQYKLRHNWTRGACALKEIPVAKQATIPPTLVHLHDGVVFTADRVDGLRAWTMKGQRHLAQIPLVQKDDSPPTSIAVDKNSAAGDSIVVVGFENGSFSIYRLAKDRSRFFFLTGDLDNAPANGVLSAVAISWPYFVTLTATQLLTLYRCDIKSSKKDGTLQYTPRILHSLTSRTVWPPMSISLRVSSPTVTVSIAFAQPTYLSGWTVGIQEVTVNSDGELLQSRMATAIDQHYRPLAFAARPMFPHILPFQGTANHAASTRELRHIHAKPNSLSYTHPYLLVSHPDNTLTIYLVTSTAEFLSISAGSRLWGHTSSVSGAHVGGRGKAVSVSRRGDELRVWELEGGFTSANSKKRLADGAISVQVKPAHISITNGSNASQPLTADDKARPIEEHASDAAGESSDVVLTRGWIGFDDESICFLKEEGQGKQALMVFDFS